MKRLEHKKYDSITMKNIYLEMKDTNHKGNRFLADVTQYFNELNLSFKWKSYIFMDNYKFRTRFATKFNKLFMRLILFYSNALLIIKN